MKVKTQNPLNRQILDEASSWFVDFRVGDVDAAARARFDEWLRRSPEHIRAYWEIAKTYVELPSSREAGALDVKGLVAYANAQGSVMPLTATSPTEVRFGPAAQTGRPFRLAARRRHLIAAAACALLMLSAALWWQRERYPLYTTDIGERRSLTLADGSTVDLNARSSIRVEFSHAERRIELSGGQVLFQVAKDHQRPFIVHAGDTTVRAVGTEFNVNRRASGTTITVLEGRVAVYTDAHEVAAQSPVSGSTEVVLPRPAMPPGLTDASGAAAVYLSAGEQVTITPAARSIPHPADLAAATAWLQRRAMVFDGTKLSDVVEEFNLYNRRQLVIDGAQLSDFRVSGVYSSTDPSSLLRFLRDQPGVRIVETGTEVRIVPQ